MIGVVGRGFVLCVLFSHALLFWSVVSSLARFVCGAVCVSLFFAVFVLVLFVGFCCVGLFWGFCVFVFGGFVFSFVVVVVAFCFACCLLGFLVSRAPLFQ